MYKYGIHLTLGLSDVPHPAAAATPTVAHDPMDLDGVRREEG